MKKVSANLKLILVGAIGFGGITLYDYFRYKAYLLKNTISPLGNIVKEAESFDTSPKDSTLSIQESEKFIQSTLKNKIVSDADKESVKQLIKKFSNEPYGNTQETAKNMQSALEFILIRQSISHPDENTQNKLYPQQERVQELSYSDFSRLAFQEEKPLLKRVVLQNSSEKLLAVFLDNSKNEVTIPSDLNSLKDLADKLTSKSIEVEIQEKPGLDLLPYILFFGPILLVVLFVSRSLNKQWKFTSMLTKLSNAKVKADDKITFDKVAGIDEVKVELKEIVDFLKDPKKYNAIGAKAPKGVLLVGPPGTGKTLCAKAVAGEAEVPFFSLSGSDFVEMFVGVGASRVRNLFKEANANAPCVIFIDELDAVGRHRGAGLGGGHDEREQTLNQLLVEMDGFGTGKGIIVLAATNRPDILDNALLRPGRFDRQIVVDRPDVKGREEILKIHVQDKPLAEDVDLKVIAQRTPGFTGADLANVLNEAALLAARKNKTRISMLDIEEAIDKVIAGPEKKSKIISPENKKLTSYHEIGHALVAFYDEHSDPLHKVSIIPRGMTLGLTMTRPEEDHLNYSKLQLLSRIRVLLGGRVAEEIVFNDVTTGAEDDLKRAADIAAKMVTKFGMSEKLGLLTFDQESENVFLGKDIGHTRNYSEETAKEIDAEKKRIIDKLHEEVKALLMSKRKHLDALSKVLLEKETLDVTEVKNVVEEVDKTLK